MPEFSRGKIKVVDLFCGIGGLTRGLLDAKLDVVAGIDSDERCQYAYEHNNKAKFIHQKVEDVTRQQLSGLFGGAKWKVIVGCAPCQPFSAYTVKNRRLTQGRIQNSGNWNLISDFARAIGYIRPDVVSMENVPAMMKQTIYTDFCQKLAEMGYAVNAKIVNCNDYDVPQSRRRLVLLASKHGEIKLPPISKAEKKKLRDVIGDLPPLKNGGQCPKDRFHKVAELSDINMKRIKASRPGGTWKEWHPSLLPECYKRKSGQTFQNVYGRLDWNAVAPTMTGQFHRYGTGRFGHPEQDRALSLREGALIQSFPRRYVFADPKEDFATGAVSLHIGNAVPVKLGKAIGKAIYNHLTKESNYA